MYLFRLSGDANLDVTVTPARLRSSFIYLANAVNDLSGEWSVLALILAPLILAASLCLLPDALNLQSRVAHTFDSDAHSVNVMFHKVALRQTQAPYHPQTSAAPDPYPDWLITTLHLIFPLVVLMVILVVLCLLARKRSQQRAPAAVAEAIAIYKQAVGVAPAYFWVSFLQFLVMTVACLIFAIPLMLLHIVFFGSVAIDPFVKIPLFVPLVLTDIVLHFSKIALIFDGVHSWSALLRSRELQRGRFFKVAMRIVVFLAMLSGYDSWASGAFLVVSILIGPVAAVTGYVWSAVFVLDLLSVGVAYFTIAFFVAAGVRLYQDLIPAPQEQAVVVNGPLAATAALPAAVASAS